MIKARQWEDVVKIEPTLDSAWDDSPSSDLFINPQYLEESELASDSQVGGDHYTKLEIQPMTYSMANGLNALQHTALKYITRYQDKGTPMQDLAKARHCIDMMVEDWMDREE